MSSSNGITLQIPVDLLGRIDGMASKAGMGRSELIRQLLTESMKTPQSTATEPAQAD